MPEDNKKPAAKDVSTDASSKDAIAKVKRGRPSRGSKETDLKQLNPNQKQKAFLSQATKWSPQPLLFVILKVSVQSLA